MSKRILLIQGHPDASQQHFCHALEDAYASGATVTGGNEIRRIRVAALDFPLWLGDMPALLKGFLEQVARPGFAFSGEGENPLARKELAGRTARVVVTMGMPTLMYRWYFRAHSIKSLERNILGFLGIFSGGRNLDRIGWKNGTGDCPEMAV